MWWKIRLQLKSNLKFNWIWTVRFLHLIIHLAQNKKLNSIHVTKFKIQLKFNWIFFEFWLYIYKLNNNKIIGNSLIFFCELLLPI